MILIDLGNSHNILQPCIAHHLNLPITLSSPLSVMVGNGTFIQCQGIDPLINISLQTSTFTIPFYLLSIEEVDVILGIGWLSTLRPIKTDFLSQVLHSHTKINKLSYKTHIDNYNSPLTLLYKLLIH